MAQERLIIEGSLWLALKNSNLPFQKVEFYVRHRNQAVWCQLTYTPVALGLIYITLQSGDKIVFSLTAEHGEKSWVERFDKLGHDHTQLLSALESLFVSFAKNFSEDMGPVDTGIPFSIIVDLDEVLLTYFIDALW